MHAPQADDSQSDFSVEMGNRTNDADLDADTRRLDNTVSDPQLGWLEQGLRTGAHAIAFCHHPLDAQDTSRHRFSEDRHDLASANKGANRLAVLAGHLARLQLRRPVPVQE